MISVRLAGTTVSLTMMLLAGCGPASPGYFVPNSKVAFPGNGDGWCPKNPDDGKLLELPRRHGRPRLDPQPSDKAFALAERSEPPRAVRRTKPDLSSPPSGPIDTLCVVTLEGTLEDCCVIKGIEGHNREVLNALKDWRFEPAKLDGKPNEAVYLVRITGK